jgi:type IV secretory pathway VirB10-like protein
MKCDRLLSLVKNWYLKVQEEAMAPARMVAFIEQHISQCEECMADPDVKEEAEKIREIVLPPAKAPKPKAVRAPKEEAGSDDKVEEEEESTEEETSEEVNSDDENGMDEELDPDEIDDELI